MDSTSIRPTKKQRELLQFIEEFIKEHGYSPSYREVMNGLNYTSVATVSLHINSLIRRGHLRKRDRSARSLEVIKTSGSSATTSERPQEEQWLADRVEEHFSKAESAEEVSQQLLLQLSTLVDALKVLKMQLVAESYQERLELLSERSR